MKPEDTPGLELLEALADGTISAEGRARLDALARQSEQWRAAIEAYTPLEASERAEMIAAALKGDAPARRANAVWSWLKKKVGLRFSRPLILLAPAATALIFWLLPRPMPAYVLVPSGFGLLCRGLVTLRPNEPAPSGSECKTWGMLPEEASWYDAKVEVAVFDEAERSTPLARSLEPKSGTLEVLKPPRYHEHEVLYFVIARPGEVPPTLDQALARCSGPGDDCQVLKLEP